MKSGGTPIVWDYDSGLYYEKSDFIPLAFSENRFCLNFRKGVICILRLYG